MRSLRGLSFCIAIFQFLYGYSLFGGSLLEENFIKGVKAIAATIPEGVFRSFKISEELSFMLNKATENGVLKHIEITLFYKKDLNVSAYFFPTLYIKPDEPSTLFQAGDSFKDSGSFGLIPLSIENILRRQGQGEISVGTIKKSMETLKGTEYAWIRNYFTYALNFSTKVKSVSPSPKASAISDVMMKEEELESFDKKAILSSQSSTKLDDSNVTRTSFEEIFEGSKLPYSKQLFGTLHIRIKLENTSEHIRTLSFHLPLEAKTPLLTLLYNVDTRFIQIKTFFSDDFNKAHIERSLLYHEFREAKKYNSRFQSLMTFLLTKKRIFKEVEMVPDIDLKKKIQELCDF